MLEDVMEPGRGAAPCVVAVVPASHLPPPLLTTTAASATPAVAALGRLDSTVQISTSSMYSLGQWQPYVSLQHAYGVLINGL